MSLDLKEIIGVAQAILDRLSNTNVHWKVTEAAPFLDSAPDMLGPGFEAPRTVLITATSEQDQRITVRSYFVSNVPKQQAIMQLASSLQDEVIEAVQAAVPPCPEHSHPLAPRIVGDLAVWVCPLGVGPQQAIAGGE